MQVAPTVGPISLFGPPWAQNYSRSNADRMLEAAWDGALAFTSSENINGNAAAILKTRD